MKKLKTIEILQKMHKYYNMTNFNLCKILLSCFDDQKYKTKTIFFFSTLYYRIQLFNSLQQEYTWNANIYYSIAIF